MGKGAGTLIVLMVALGCVAVVEGGCSLLVDASGLSGAAADAGTAPSLEGGGIDPSDGSVRDGVAADTGAPLIVATTVPADTIRVTGTVPEAPASEVNAGRGSNGGNVRQTGIRFADLQVPKGAKIDSARMKLVSSEVQTGTATNTALFFEAADSAAAWSGTFPDFDARIRGRKILWPTMEPWSQAVAYETPELATALQEIIDRAGWAPGNAVVLFWSDDGSVGTAQQRVAFIGSAPSLDPVLTVHLH